MREFITGNQAIARGAVHAGCDFFAGYPITPASSILTEMITEFRNQPGRAVQTEDEIAAIGQCIGAAMAGAKAMTASSGPGLSLYSENIGLAQMIEAPLVVVDCQRMGPATGGATTNGEGDVLFARHVTSGGYPLVVLVACDITSAYCLTIRAFNIAETLRTPVILLMSKDISMTRQTVDLDAVDLTAVTKRLASDSTAAYRPYEVQTPEDIPRFEPLGGRTRVRATGSIHDPDGLLTTDRGHIHRKLLHLRDKITTRADWLADARFDLDDEATTLLVSYGLVDGAAREAVARVRSAGDFVSHLTLYTLWPLPQSVITQALTPRIERVVMPELNIGLYVDELRRMCGSCPVESIVRFDGGLIDPQTIVGHLQDLVAQSAEGVR